ncbi:MAG: tRNA (adenosine(37)-N6)-threonylcarbamoyltransferase complex dimerization subunit type 1 TsaB, partial [Planctomycetaceae bacterium]|nr:tRNA (adenosine(37)-N6)-threonylcarbamoyltransferase complex dimerization subunit type 1 TsaB [Planctomycetaceae bacterium]
TSGQSGSVAALVGEQVVAQITLDPQRRSAQTLAPAMRELLVQAGWQPAMVDVVGVAVGPGSFTGLRVGVTTAKTFAYAVGCRVVAINTLDVIAEQAQPQVPLEMSRLSVVIDAQRGDVFARLYERGAVDTWQPVSPAAIQSHDAWRASLGSSTAVSGPALEKLAPSLSPEVIVMPRELWSPEAVTVGRLAARCASREQFDDVWQLAPLYMRRSAAEDVFDRKAAET